MNWCIIKQWSLINFNYCNLTIKLAITLNTYTLNSKQINILTIDCEDFFSLPAFKNIDIQYDWDKLINKQIDLLLKTLLSANDTKATFFIVG